jgi:glycosyltransferase involved in cell wall biosynthesis
MQPLSVVIITYNEERNIGRCIESVKTIANEVIVVDSFSYDRTVEIASALGATVTSLKFDGYIKQKNKAINLATNNYVLLLDADEALSEELAASILKVKDNFTYRAYAMKRCNIFRGKPIRHGLWYPDKKLRLFDKRFGACGGLNPHDKIIMHKPGNVKLLEGDMLHYTYDTLEEYRQRNEEVSTIAARSLHEAGIRWSRWKIVFSPLWAFINGYFLRLGFLEGYEGFVIAVNTSQQCYAKYQKLRQLQRDEVAEVAWDKSY